MPMRRSIGHEYGSVVYVHDARAGLPTGREIIEGFQL
jgi:hypothetical protein